MPIIKNKVSTARAITEGEVKELIDQKLREAFRDHSRDLEVHLKSIHDRLIVLEPSRRR